MPRLLLLITTRSYRAGAFLDAARAMGVDFTVGSERAQALAPLHPIGHLQLAFRDAEGALARVLEFARLHPLDAVVAADDDGALLAARACEALGLRGHRPGAVAAARDKLAARDAFARAGLPTPRFAAAPLSGDPRAWATNVAYPCVLKPRGLSASRGVIRANDPGEFVAAFERIRAMLEREPPSVSGEPPVDSVLVEDYIPGIEVALEGLVTGGRLDTLALFDKPDPLEGPYFEETIYVTPSRHDAARQAAIADAAERAVRALGLENGPVHAELRCNDRGVWPLEIAPRSIGGLCSRALRFGSGRSLEELLLRQALGLDLRGANREAAASGVMMIPIPRAGILRGIQGIERARGEPGIVEVRISMPLGSRLVPLPEGSQYLGFLFARSGDPEAAERALRGAHRALTFEIESNGTSREERQER